MKKKLTTRLLLDQTADRLLNAYAPLGITPVRTDASAAGRPETGKPEVKAAAGDRGGAAGKPETGRIAVNAIAGDRGAAGTVPEKQPTNAPAAPASPKETLLTALLGQAMAAPAGDALGGVNRERLYDDYFRRYADSAALAAKNAFGLAAASTGGYGSSWASSAAAAAYDSRMRELDDRALEIEKLSQSADSLALAREKQRSDALYRALGLLNDADETAYRHGQDQLALAFKAAAVGDDSLLAALGIDASGLRREKQLAEALRLAEIGDYTGLQALGADVSALTDRDALSAAVTAAKYGDYAKLEALGFDMTGQKNKDALSAAATAAEYGDYTGLQALGIDVSGLRYRELLDVAATLASFGDYSALEELGVDTTSLYEQGLLEKALALAKYGDYSLLGSFAANGGDFKQKISVSIQKGAQEAYWYGGYDVLLRYLDRQVGYGQLTEDGKRQILETLVR